jgi:FkbM family methyltransferase
MNNPLKRIRRAWGFLRTQDAFRQAPLLTLFRSASWYWRCLWGRAAVVDLRRWHLQMFLPTGWRGFGKFIFAFRESYEPELAYLERILSPGRVFVDVGANFGIYTLVASRLVGDAGRVIAFEPSIQSFPVLQKNIALNNQDNVLALRTALSERGGRAWLYHALDPVCDSLGRDSSSDGAGEEVVLDSFDNVLKESGLDRVDVIKVDVEGAEELVLRGAIRSLTTYSPVVIFEFNPGCAVRLGLSPDGATDFLESLGYEFVLLGDCANCKNPASRPTYFNIVAIPKQFSGEFSRSFHSLRGQSQNLRRQESCGEL